MAQKYTKAQFQDMTRAYDPAKRKQIAQSLIAQGAQIEGLNAPESQAAMPATQAAPQAAPEQPKEDGWLKKTAKGAANFAGQAALQVGKGATDLASLGSKINRFASKYTYEAPITLYEKLSGKDVMTPSQFLDEKAQKGLAFAKGGFESGQEKLANATGAGSEGFTTKAGKFVGEIAPMLIGAGAGAKFGKKLAEKGASLLSKVTTKTAPKVMTAAERLAMKSPTVANALPRAVGASIGATEGAAIAGEGRFATPAELAVGGAFDAATGGLGRLLKKGSKTLFTASIRPPKKAEEELYKQFGKTVGDLVEKYDLTKSTTSNLTKVKKLKKEAWETLKDAVAKDKTPLTEMDFRKVKDGLLKPFAGRADNVALKREKELVSNLVDDLIPKNKSMSKAQLVEEITAANQKLYNYGATGVLSPKKAKGLENQIKNAFKKYLPKKAQEIYPRYAELSKLQSWIGDEQVRRFVGRQALGASIGAGTGYATGGDITSALLGGVIGAGSNRLLGSPGVINAAGRGLRAIGKGLEKTQIPSRTLIYGRD